MDHAETAPGEHRIVTGYTSAETTHKRVLVVDNNPFHRELLRHTLEPLGFIVYEAMDGTEVLAACKQIKPDIVLMDLQMSGIDGVTVTKQLKQQPDCSKIPVIALSTSPIADELAKQGKEKDAFAGYVNKPFSTILLLELIATQTADNAQRTHHFFQTARDLNQQGVASDYCEAAFAGLAIDDAGDARGVQRVVLEVHRQHDGGEGVAHIETGFEFFGDKIGV